MGKHQKEVMEGGKTYGVLLVLSTTVYAISYTLSQGTSNVPCNLLPLPAPSLLSLAAIFRLLPLPSYL